MMRTPAFSLALLGLLTWTVVASADEKPEPEQQSRAAAKVTVVRQNQRANSLYLSDLVRSFTRMYYNQPEVNGADSRRSPALALK